MAKRQRAVEPVADIPIEEERDEFYPPAEPGNVHDIAEDEFEPIEFPELVDEVLAGKWGTGQNRRRKLAEAGYDHVAVQKEIVRRANGR